MFTDKFNVISMDESFWRHNIRPALLQNSEWAPQDDDEDINSFVIRDPESKRIIVPKYFWHATHDYLSKKIDSELLKQNLILPKKFKDFDTIDISIKDGVVPRPHQTDIIERLAVEYNNTGILRKIVRGSTGFGKTFVALYTILYKLKIKPLIIVHNEVLYQQWINAMKNFFHITDDMIGGIQGSDLEKIEKIIDRPILIVKVQSLLSQVKRCELDDLYELYNTKGRIGIVVPDEAHLSSAALKFAKPSSIFATHNVLALSATPFRKGLHKLVMASTVGTDIIESNHVNMIPKVYINIVDSNVSKSDYAYIQRMAQYVQKLAVYNKIVTKNPTFTSKIVEKIESLVNSGHRVLVIAANNTMVYELEKILNAMDIKSSAFTAKDRDYGDADVIISNQQMSSTGFSQDDLSALVLVNGTIGKVQLIQSIGRVLRIMEGKNDPEVHIIFDKLFIKAINNNAPFIIKNNLKGEFTNLKIIINEE